MNQETALKIIIGVAKRSTEVTECKSSKTQKELQQAIRVCQTLADNREAKRSWRESCGQRRMGVDMPNGATAFITGDPNMPKKTAEALRAMMHIVADNATACYLIERKHSTRPDKWKVVGEFVAGSPWRDGRPVDDETMREEVKGYRRTWTAYIARVRCPNGEILPDNS